MLTRFILLKPRDGFLKSSLSFTFGVHPNRFLAKVISRPALPGIIGGKRFINDLASCARERGDQFRELKDRELIRIAYIDRGRNIGFQQPENPVNKIR